MLKDEVKHTSEIIEKLKKSLVVTNTQKVKVSTTRGKVRFYLSDGKYLSKEQLPLIKKLVQEEYNEKAFKAAQKKLKILKRAQAVLEEKPVEKVFYEMHPEKRKLIVPIEMSDEDYAKSWKNQTYLVLKLKEEEQRFVTESGVKVRSKSEWIIANILSKHNIPYRYEQQLLLDNGKFQVFPDFMVLNKRTRKEYIFEHFGRLDLPDYCATMAKKISTYQRNGFYLGDNFVFTYETQEQALDIKQVEELVRHYFE